MSKLNVNELMIGDWVLVNGNPMQIQAINDIDGEIMAGDELYCLVEDRVHSEDKIEPIPLTAEILEKNGFELVRNVPCPNKNVWSFDTFSIYEHHDKRRYPYFWIPLGDNADIKYVHELQHALRLCGIDKTIEITV